MPSSNDPVINRQKAREWRLANPDRHREYNRLWVAKKRRENPEWAKAQDARWRANMTPEQKEARAAYQKEWFDNNPEYGAAWQARDHEQNPTRRMVEAAKVRAKLLAVPFDLNWKDIVIPQFCPVLGIELYLGNRKVSAASPTLDRLVPVLGYVPSNVRVISVSANSTKRDKSLAQMWVYVERLRRRKKQDEAWARRLRAAEAVIAYMIRELIPPVCEECGINRSDPPSKLCPGCEAYQEHRR